MLARPVAARLLPSRGPRDEPALEQLLHAAAAAGAVSHPLLARVYDAAREARPAGGTGATVDLAYVISEWVEGPTLAAVLAAEGAWEPARACSVACVAAPRCPDR